ADLCLGCAATVAVWRERESAADARAYALCAYPGAAFARIFCVTSGTVSFDGPTGRANAAGRDDVVQPHDVAGDVLASVVRLCDSSDSYARAGAHQKRGREIRK